MAKREEGIKEGEIDGVLYLIYHVYLEFYVRRILLYIII